MVRFQKIEFNRKISKAEEIPLSQVDRLDDLAAKRQYYLR